MTASRRTTWLWAGVFGLLAGACVVSAVQMAAARDTARRALAEHAAVAQTLQEIQNLDHRPQLASVDTEQSARLTQHIETVAQQAGIEPSHIERVQAQPPRRIEGGPYLRQPTQVLLRQVTLQQLVALLHDLDKTGQSLQVDDFRLIAPHDQVVGDRWRAEFTVSYLRYEPLPTR